MAGICGPSAFRESLMQPRPWCVTLHASGARGFLALERQKICVTKRGEVSLGRYSFANFSGNRIQITTGFVGLWEL